MAGIYYGAMYGGSTTSILVNTPGESSSVVTCLDGYEMAKKGRAGPALAAAAIGSFIAGTFATLMLMLFGPWVARIALSFGPPEFFALMVAALTIVTSLAGRSMVKALLSTLFGLAIATMGIDNQSGVPRYAFGNPELMDGLEFLTVAIGLFALCEVFVNLADMKEAVQERLSIKGGLWLTKEDWKRFIPSCIRGTLSGFFVGGIAGAGAAVASFVSYGLEKKVSKHRDELGTGCDRRGDRPRIGQQRGGGRVPDPPAVSGHSGQRHDRHHAGRPAHAGPAARPAALHPAARFRLGPDRQHVHRERHAPGPQPAAGRACG